MGRQRCMFLKGGATSVELFKLRTIMEQMQGGLCNRGANENLQVDDNLGTDGIMSVEQVQGGLCNRGANENLQVDDNLGADGIMSVEQMQGGLCSRGANEN